MKAGNKILPFGIRSLLVILCLMSGFHFEIFGQGKEQTAIQEQAVIQGQPQEQPADSLKIKQHGFFIGFSMAACQSQFTQEGMLSVSGLSTLAKPGILATAEIGYAISRHFGISSGISFFSLNNQVTLNAYQNKFTTTDTENETYERRVTATNITEDQNIACLGIPLIMNLRIPMGRKLGFSLGAGVEMAFPVISKYNSSGIFTYKGYYPRYNVLLENLPAYGFPDKASISTNGNLELKPVWLNGSLNAGFYYALPKNLQLGIAFHYSRSLTDIQSYISPEKFQLSSDINQISSMMGGSNNVNYLSAGLAVTLRYFFQK